MSKRRRFTADFRAKVALEALRGDRTIQKMAARHSEPGEHVEAPSDGRLECDIFDGPTRLGWTTRGRSTIALPAPPQVQLQQQDLLNRILAA